MTSMEPSKLARCSTDPACPRRWADGGPDRPCGGHHGDDGGLAARMAAMGVTAAPGKHGEGEGEPSEPSA